MFQTKTQEQKIREKPLKLFETLPLVTETETDSEEVLQIVEALKHNRKKLYDKKC